MRSLSISYFHVCYGHKIHVFTIIIKQRQLEGLVSKWKVILVFEIDQFFEKETPEMRIKLAIEILMISQFFFFFF